MDHFQFINRELHAENLTLTALANEYQTPLYVYSKATIARHWKAFDDALKDVKHTVCYAVKANSNIAILQLMAKMGSGFDIVSGGELARVIHAGGSPKKVVFSGVGKTKQEIKQALELGIKCFNIESEAELYRIEAIAKQCQLIAPISLRVNPDIDAGTHPYISTGLKENKFGIEVNDAKALYRYAQQSPHLAIHGIDCHIGSQLTELAPFLAAIDLLLALIDELANQGINIQHIDIGGGLGVPYQGETPPHPLEYGKALTEKLAGRSLEVIVEPGRAIMANAGVLLTRVEYLKEGSEKHFAIVDAAMNDLLRPALYSAWQEIVAVTQKPSITSKTYDVVGPVCETGDFLGKERQLAIETDDLLAVRSAGAYGFTMASNYNSRGRAAEVLVDGDQHFLIRQRESIESLWQNEQLL